MPSPTPHAQPRKPHLRRTGAPAGPGTPAKPSWIGKTGSVICELLALRAERARHDAIIATLTADVQRLSRENSTLRRQLRQRMPGGAL